MRLKAQEMNRQDVNQINGEAGAGYDVDRPPKPRGERYARYIEQSADGRQQPDEPVSPHRRIIPSAQHRRCELQGDEAHRRQQRSRLRSEGRRVGKEWVSTWRYRWTTTHKQKTKYKIIKDSN